VSTNIMVFRCSNVVSLYFLPVFVWVGIIHSPLICFFSESTLFVRQLCFRYFYKVYLVNGPIHLEI
jgi:hypothetical protein